MKMHILNYPNLLQMLIYLQTLNINLAIKVLSLSIFHFVINFLYFLYFFLFFIL